MSGTNRYLVQQAAVVENPLTFTSTTGAASIAALLVINNANLDLLIEALTMEETDPDYKRGFLDEMSPPARITLYKIITDLKAKTIA